MAVRGYRKQKQRCPAAQRPWQAASARLPSELQYYDHLYPEHRELFDVEWRRHTRLLQFDEAKRFRSKRISPQLFYSAVYEPQWCISCGDAQNPRSSWQRSDPFEHTPYSSIIRTEYIKSILKERAFYSIGSTLDTIKLFKIIWLIPPRKKFVRTSEMMVRRPLMMSVQFISIHDPPSFEAGFPEKLDVFFTLGESETISFLKLGEWKMLRESLRQWTRDSSTVAGCFALVSPCRAEPKLSELGLLDEKAPFLMILERVYVLGWKAATEQSPCIPTTSPHAGMFALSKLTQRVKPYFQCLLLLPQLWEKGLRVFPHSVNAAFYTLLMKSPDPATVQCGLKATEYEEQGVGLNPPAPMPAQPEDELVHSDHEASVDGSDFEPEAKRLARPRRTRAAKGAPVGSDGNGSESSASSSQPDVKKAQSGRAKWPTSPACA